VTVSVTRFSQASGGTYWEDENVLTYSSTLNASGFRYTGYLSLVFPSLYLSKPSSIQSLPDGTRLDNLKVEFEAGRWGGSSVGLPGKLTGGDNKSGGTLSFQTYSTFTFDGDAAYWGISDSPTEFFKKLRDGDIDFILPGYTSSSYVAADDVRVKDMVVTITYTEVDTKRAALMSTIP
jgi:hypothetical protein